MKLKMELKKRKKIKMSGQKRRGRRRKKKKRRKPERKTLETPATRSAEMVRCSERDKARNSRTGKAGK